MLNTENCRIVKNKKKDSAKILPQLPNIRYTNSDTVLKDWQSNPNKKSAVGVLFVLNATKKNAEILFTKRSLLVKTHKGQIGFAGGKYEAGENSPFNTAIREIEEEISLPATQMSLHGFLQPIKALDGHQVYPVVLSTNQEIKNLTPNSSEVDSIFTIDWLKLQQKHAEFFQFNYFGIWRNSVRFDADSFNIWGLTAQILHQANFHL